MPANNNGIEKIKPGSGGNHVFVVMGVSGTGKTTIAKMVSHELDAALLDGDFLHSRADIAKMSEGIPLTDEDRYPWLGAINDAIFAMQRSEPVSLLICSALKKQYRDLLRDGNGNVSFLYLKGDFSLIEERMKKRSGHFFTSKMLRSQFEALEEPDTAESDVYAIDVTPEAEAVACNMIRTMKAVLGVS